MRLYVCIFGIDSVFGDIHRITSIADTRAYTPFVSTRFFAGEYRQFRNIAVSEVLVIRSGYYSGFSIKLYRSPPSPVRLIGSAAYGAYIYVIILICHKTGSVVRRVGYGCRLSVVFQLSCRKRVGRYYYLPRRSRTFRLPRYIGTVARDIAYRDTLCLCRAARRYRTEGKRIVFYRTFATREARIRSIGCRYYSHPIVACTYIRRY